MRPVSEGFLRSVRGSHRMAARVRLVDPGQTGTDPTGVEVPTHDGFVELDSAASIRGTVDVTVQADWPTDPADPLAPYGQEIFVERGLVYGNGVTEWVSLGYFRIDDLAQASVPNGAVRVLASDRMAGLLDATLLAPRQFTAGSTVGDVVSDLVTEVYPSAVIEWDEPAARDALLARSVICEEHRHDFVDELVTARGKEWHFDYRGHLVIRDVPDPDEPVFTVDGGEGGVLVELSRRLSRSGVYNGVIAVGEAPDTTAPVRAVAVDNDPASPTYWEGTFGKVPRHYFSPFITTEAQAQSAAEAILKQSLGVPYAVDLSAVPNPALEPLDPIRVVYPKRGSSRNMREEAHVIERLAIPLTAALPLTGSTREQSFSTIGFLT